jgi:uncharacterized protein
MRQFDLAFIFVEGAYQAGKTTFVCSIAHKDIVDHQFSSRQQWIEFKEQEILEQRLGTSWDFGRIVLEDAIDAIIYMMALPRSEMFDFCTKQMYATDNPNVVPTIGYVVLVDSTNPAMFFWAQNILDSYKDNPFPYIVACNKQDSPDAWSPEDLRIALNIAPEIPVVPCVAAERESVKNVLLALLYHVRDGLEQEA